MKRKWRRLACMRNQEVINEEAPTLICISRFRRASSFLIASCTAFEAGLTHCTRSCQHAFCQKRKEKKGRRGRLTSRRSWRERAESESSSATVRGRKGGTGRKGGQGSGCVGASTSDLNLFLISSVKGRSLGKDADPIELIIFSESTEGDALSAVSFVVGC